MKCAFSILRSFNVRVESVEDCVGNVSTLRETRYALEIYSSILQLFLVKVLFSGLAPFTEFLPACQISLSVRHVFRSFSAHSRSAQIISRLSSFPLKSNFQFPHKNVAFS